MIVVHTSKVGMNLEKGWEGAILLVIIFFLLIRFWNILFNRLLFEMLHRGRKFKNHEYRRDCRKSPQADSWVRCRKKWPHRMRHNQRSHNYEGSWDPRKSPINYTEGFFDSLGRSPHFFKILSVARWIWNFHLQVITDDHNQESKITSWKRG
jgi:hypothetical protein